MWLSGFSHFSWWQDVIVALVLTHITIAGVTIFLHRHQAHRALELGPVASHFFRFWLWLTTGMVTKEWAAIHRKHHAKCETVEDPHSPQILGINKVLWGGVALYVKESRNKTTMERYGHGTPDDWMERHVYSKHSRLGVTIMALVNMSLFGVIPGMLIWLVQMLWIPFWAAGVVNGLGHFWGYRNYECRDASTNIFPWGIIIGGEELHNNHHTFATSAKLSNRWYEFDIGWMYIRILEMLGQAKVKNVAPTVSFDRKKSSCDEATLQAIIRNRYDVIARYSAELSKTCSQELNHLKIGHGLPKRSEMLAMVNRWLHRDSDKLKEQDRQVLSTVMAESKCLQTVITMRDELAALWTKTNANKDQLVNDLRAWCDKAESSGIIALEKFSHTLKAYV
ncbi:MAG: acyl-CoA desaturase [Ferrovum sp. 37-45-19]|uniref:DesA family fatty acid desaturase n=1 Tax=Ferrovum sp. JA12 TaxID=1356299 RepID=UPI0007034705|nr:fatty acid desaturase [Ferrovum sp. JA12]OYV79864.1 MAG: acyl-CoA desaturase [Ferrovum sp. 21-44-67]OYV95488.1 MAG: acyl-CoA desaturase [Ferrovum sp. 37-45-19]OZB31533.1 MAG: acyl-CoA desaturase [Ferrovum sp. 34-44-207]HQT81284.1 fatty acid desaturase [Ferrovaceae bacterium]KRH78172.1 fatty acid desaturase [Ferrovum sp. JA12]